jgi:hypothetical protein
MLEKSLSLPDYFMSFTSQDSPTEFQFDRRNKFKKSGLHSGDYS